MHSKFFQLVTRQVTNSA